MKYPSPKKNDQRAMTVAELDEYIAWLGAGPDFGHFRNDLNFIREILDEGRRP